MCEGVPSRRALLLMHRSESERAGRCLVVTRATHCEAAKVGAGILVAGDLRDVVPARGLGCTPFRAPRAVFANSGCVLPIWGHQTS